MCLFIMELAILGGLALVGWSLSPAGISRRVQHTRPVRMTNGCETATDVISEYPFDPDTQHQELLDTDTRQIQEHIRDTRGVLQEYSRSDKTASVDTQRKMELFTGNDLSWKKKDDVPRLFQPTETRVAVSSGGGALSATSYDASVLKDRSVFAGTMNNALPFAQERVGPGLGVDANVPSTDGLHSQFRVLPMNTLNAHRTNQLPGLSSSGANQIASGSRRFDSFSQTQPSLVNHTPNQGPGRSSFQAQAFYPTIVEKHTRSERLGAFPRAVGGCVKTCGAPSHPRLTSMPTKRDVTLPVGSGASATQYEMYEHSGRTLRDPKAGSLSYEAGQTMTNPGSSVAMGGIASEMTGSTLRELEQIQGVGGVSYLSAPRVRSRVRQGSRRAQEGRANHGSVQGGLTKNISSLGDIHTRKSKENAYDRLQAGGAPYAQQRESSGYQKSKKKVRSQNPYGEWDSLGLGLVD